MIYFICICVWGYKCGYYRVTCRVNLFFHNIGSKNPPKISRLSGNYLHPLNHLAVLTNAYFFCMPLWQELEVRRLWLGLPDLPLEQLCLFSFRSISYLCVGVFSFLEVLRSISEHYTFTSFMEVYYTSTSFMEVLRSIGEHHTFKAFMQLLLSFHGFKQMAAEFSINETKN